MSKFRKRQKRLQKRERARARASQQPQPGLEVLRILDQRLDELLPKPPRDVLVSALASNN